MSARDTPSGDVGSPSAAPRPAARNRVSIYDVATRAGVSHMTVSRVLNGHPNIREGTRRRVLEAVEALNYTRSPIARALVTRRSSRIGVLINGNAQNGPNLTLRAFEKAAQAHGYAVAAISTDDEDQAHVEAGVLELATQGVDGLCVIAPSFSVIERLDHYAKGLPTVIVKDEPEPGMRAVSYDQRQGTFAAISHLMELGHRKIVHLAGSLDWADGYSRERAWRSVLERTGVEVPELAVGDWSGDSGYEFARDYDFQDATAIFAANDQMAIGILHGLRDRGIRVPSDMSVVGFDDLDEARHVLPPLTTVRQDFWKLGRAMMAGLLAEIEGCHVDMETLVPELVIRESTAPPPR